MEEACQRMLREYEDGVTSDDDFKKKKHELLMLFHPDKAPLRELVPYFTEVAKILNTQLNVPS
jgi:preprotein translocase subunit Sec63